MGSATADDLARLGYREFVLVDDDAVEADNIRKSVYTHRHVGMRKTEALEAHLKEIDPEVTCVTFDRFIEDLDDRMWETILDCALVAEMADSRQGAQACVERLARHHRETGEQIPLVKMLSLDNIAAGVTMVWVPGSGKPCPNCLFRATPHINTSDERERRNDEDYKSDRITGFVVRGVRPDLHFGLALTVSVIHALLFEPASEHPDSGRVLQLVSMLEGGPNILLWSPFRDPYLEWQKPAHMGRAIGMELASEDPCIYCGRYMQDSEEEGEICISSEPLSSA